MAAAAAVALSKISLSQATPVTIAENETSNSISPMKSAIKTSDGGVEWARHPSLPELPVGPRPSDAMRVNVVKALEDCDYRYAKALCDDESEDRWQLAYRKKATKVWTSVLAKHAESEQRGDFSQLQMIRARAEYPDVDADLLYAVLQDPAYRHKWDKYMLKQEAVGYINPNNDVCYYALGAFPPFRSRDFVLQRSWLDIGTEKFILAHSVCHERFFPTKGYVRGVVYLTAYFIRALPKGGCQFTYLTLSDPRGRLPDWLINRVTAVVAPRLLKKLRKACEKYPEWSQKHTPGWSNGAFSDMADYKRIDLSMCIPPKENNAESDSLVDETAIAESQIPTGENEEDAD